MYTFIFAYMKMILKESSKIKNNKIHVYANSKSNNQSIFTGKYLILSMRHETKFFGSFHFSIDYVYAQQCMLSTLNDEFKAAVTACTFM